MKLSAIVLGFSAFGGAAAQAANWGQCGGQSFMGPTTCQPGWTCFYHSEFYSQCLQIVSSSTSTTSSSTSSKSSSTSKTSSSTKISTTSSVSSSKTSSSSIKTSSSVKTSSTVVSVSSTATGACTAVFTPVTASAAFAALSPGWNLGNTLDAVPNEGSWNNPPVVPATFDQIKAAGFKSVRIPVTWADHFTGSSPNWTVTPAWMDRVETVVDQALARGFSVILNVHHDSWQWADITVTGNYPVIEEKFGALWLQIAKRFACKSSKLIFEAINEPTGSTQAHATELNKLNDIFLTAVNNAGGFNAQRVLSLSGLNMDAAKTSQWFVRGSLYPNQPWGLQFHYYSPYDYIFGAWGKTIWGSDADKAALDLDFSLFKGNFTNIPTFVGEWDASPASTETAARWKYWDFFVKTCNKYGYSSVLWDNGNDFFQRASGTFNDPVALDLYMNVAAGKTNTLADSTTDPAATVQSSSAYIFHQVGTPVVAQTATYLLNGNTLSSIKNSAGTTLSLSQYTWASGTLTLSATYLSTLYTSTASVGVKETLSLQFSSGTHLTLTIIQYGTPTVATSTYKAQSTDLLIPVNWAGLAKVAAIKALKADGTYLADDWTVYLGPLQNARWTYGNWGYDASNIIIYGSGGSAIIATGQTVTLTVEFFPRSLGLNSLNITITQ